MAKRNLFEDIGAGVQGAFSGIGQFGSEAARGLFPGAARSADADRAYKQSLTSYYNRGKTSGGPDDELQTLMAVMRNTDASPEFKEAAAQRMIQLPGFQQAFGDLGGTKLVKDSGQSPEQQLQMFNRLAANSTVWDPESGGPITSEVGEFYKEREAELVDMMKKRGKTKQVGGGGAFGGIGAPQPDTSAPQLQQLQQPLVGPPEPQASLAKPAPKQPPVLSKPDNPYKKDYPNAFIENGVWKVLKDGKKYRIED